MLAVKFIFFTVFSSSYLFLAEGARCEILPPISGEGQDIGVIFVPGANYPGERYQPLGEQIQMALPEARVWIGLTEGWLIDTPNPVEIGAAIADCRSMAEEMGLGGGVYMAGHSLGGIMIQQFYGDDYSDVSGLILFGSYITNFLYSDNNIGVPTLTIVGDIDGLSLSYVYREYQESQLAESQSGSENMYPVYLVPNVNHAQIGSGDVPQFVLDRDIPAEIDDAAAHEKLAQGVMAFLVKQNLGSFSDVAVEQATYNDDFFRNHTRSFLEPFEAASKMEVDGDSSEWMIRGQKILLGPENENNLENLEVIDIVLPFSDLGDAKPSVEGTDCESIKVTTYCQPQYDTDLFDADALKSAKVIKAKFKLEDVVLESLCLPERDRLQCKDINMESFQVALDMASEEARERFNRIGTQLVFLDDSVSPWGPGWEFSSGLHYNSINVTHTSIYSTSLISEPDFIISSAAGMHYCDLLSPYRALEWIYISGVVGKA